jgi:hypothetical protein
MERKLKSGLPITGRDLCREWKVNARCYYHENGTIYDFPLSFPAALCDLSGYAYFETEKDLRTCAGVRVYRRGKLSRSECIDVKGTVSGLPSYKRMRRAA